MVVPRTQCISIIDESSPSTSTHSNDWNNFRANFPNNSGTGREFWLLQPAGSRWDFGDLNRPNNFLNDSLANGQVGGGTFTVNRDNGVVANRSDWFAITNLSSQPPGSYVSVWLDISGSMVYNTVRASYEYFVERCTNAGINIILETSNSGERWIPGHNEFFVPSASFSTDPNFLTNFNEQNSITIDYGALLGLYVWQTYAVNHRQNDAILAAFLFSFNYKEYEISQHIRGFRGYLENGDFPLIYALNISKKWDSYQLYLQYQQSLHDYPYNSIQIGCKYYF